MQEYALTSWTEYKGLLYTSEIALQIMWKGGHFQQVFMEQLVTHMKKSVWMHTQNCKCILCSMKSKIC